MKICAIAILLCCLVPSFPSPFHATEAKSKLASLSIACFEIRGMSPLLAVICIGAGVIVLILGFSIKQFYGIKGLNLKPTDQAIDPDLGRLVFCLVGGAAILLGILDFVL